MFVLVITGGLGAGKSTATRLLVEHGAAVCSLDEIAREVLAPGSEALRRLSREFGAGVIAADGTLDRAALATIAFASSHDAQRLNAIVHPLVVARTRELVAHAVTDPDAPAAFVLEVPLLAEAPEIVDLADEVLAISAPEETRIARAVARGMDETDARHRLACQATDAEREALATRVIVNDGTPEAFRRAVLGYWSDVCARHAAGRGVAGGDARG